MRNVGEESSFVRLYNEGKISSVSYFRLLDDNSEEHGEFFTADELATYFFESDGSCIRQKSSG